MRSENLPEAGAFRISSYSGGGNCVEVGKTPDGSVIVRDSKDPHRAVALMFNRDEWAAFVLGVKNAEFEP
jgi:uncharacterized protein DUF397